MSALDPADHRRLQGSLARLGSPHEGEIIAAAAAVRRILDKAGATFSDLALPSALPPLRQHDRPEHQQRAEELLASEYPWSPWAESFLAEILSWRSPLSPRQADILAELEAEAGMGRAA